MYLLHNCKNCTQSVLQLCTITEHTAIKHALRKAGLGKKVPFEAEPGCAAWQAKCMARCRENALENATTLHCGGGVQ